MAYNHGVRVKEQATSLVAPVTGTAGLQVIIGTAPVNLAADPYKATNVPMIAYSFSEAVEQVGYSDDFKNYTLCQSMDACFRVLNVAPIILINVLDPKKHKKANEEQTVNVEKMQATVKVAGILADTVEVKANEATLTAGTDYITTFDDDGYLVITLTAGGKGASAKTLTVNSTSIDPTAVKKRTPKIIFEHGKRRKIYMPEIHEQWLHHIIVLVLEPIITATAYPYSCGSFPTRGAHYGKRQIERWLLHDPKGTRCFAKMDIRHFYDSIRLKILMKELAIRIKDDWFLYIIGLCLQGFNKGIPLGFYISQWLANYLLEPLDRLITEVLGLPKLQRYMDDIVIFASSKKVLQRAIVEIRKMLGQRFKLKLKHNYQVCKFYYEKGKRKIGRALDFMGFIFYRTKTLIRKNIMLSATRLAKKMERSKEANRGYFHRHIEAMLSYMGWFTCTDTYDCYQSRIKPYIHVGRLKKIISKIKRRQNHEGMDQGKMLRGAAGAAACG